jgi:hypothetical protein
VSCTWKKGRREYIKEGKGDAYLYQGREERRHTIKVANIWKEEEKKEGRDEGRKEGGGNMRREGGKGLVDRGREEKKPYNLRKEQRKEQKKEGRDVHGIDFGHGFHDGLHFIQVPTRKE